MDEREDNGSSVLVMMCFMVKAQGNTGPEMGLLSCIHSEGSASGLFWYNECTYLSNGSLETCITIIQPVNL